VLTVTIVDTSFWMLLLLSCEVKESLADTERRKNRLGKFLGSIALSVFGQLDAQVGKEPIIISICSI
jgi:hypothetical protein